MLNKDKIEKSLLLGVIVKKDWETLIRNNITKECFSIANYRLYDYIKGFVDKNTYPEIRIVTNEFNIDEVATEEYLSVSNNLDELCSVLHKEFVKNQLYYEVSQLNNYQDEMALDPDSYINRMSDMIDNLKQISYHTKSVNLFENIDNILQIDPNDVITTGFKELDKKLIGWKRGEELVIFVGRTGQGKSWICLKFAMSGALAGEKVGIYSGEMSQQQLQERMLCCAKQTVTSTNEDALKFIKDKNIEIRLLTQKELRRKATVRDIEEFIIRDHLTMVVLDQLSLMSDDTSKPGTPLRQIYGNITMDLFSLSCKYNVPIILAVQSNRQGGENKDGPAIENIAESDAVAQNATRVISMKNDTNAHILTMRIVKNRYGDSNLVQRYDVDFGKNKYKAIVDADAVIQHGSRRSTNINPFRSQMF